MEFGLERADVIFLVVLGGDLVRSTEHLGISYITAVLRQQGVKVKIAELKDLKDNNLIDRIIALNPLMVGFTITVTNTRIVIDFSNYMRKNGYSGHITAGGHMAMFAMNELLESGAFDSLSLGEGEETISELYQCIQEERDWRHLKGIAYLDKSRVVVNEKRNSIMDLDTLPFPVRDQFLEHKKTFHYLRLSSSRGCYGGCAFCSAHAFHKSPRWRGRSPKNVVAEIKQLVEEFDMHTFDFVDSTFEDPPEEGKGRIEAIARELISSGLNIFYNCCFRAENWSTQDRPLLRLLVQSGLEKVNIGLESGNDRGLGILGKRACSGDNERVLALLREFPEVYLTFGFITFHPFVTIDDLKANIDFLYNTGIGQVSRHYFWKLEIYPGTKLLSEAKAAGLLYKNYESVTGMYSYEFADSQVEKIDRQCRGFLGLQSVWDYEIFDIVLHSFLWRPLRTHPTDPDLNSFQQYINESRSKIATYNHSLLYRILEGMSDTNLKKEIELLDRLLLDEMDKIDTLKLRTGMKLLRRGVKIPQR